MPARRKPAPTSTKRGARDDPREGSREEPRFGLEWHGKRAALEAAAAPPTGRLVARPGEGAREEASQHLVIEGDNLEVLKLLRAEYAGQVKWIYIDPPYNTGRDFIYADHFRDDIGAYLGYTGQRERASAAPRATAPTNPETRGRFHTRWLSMMLPRLVLARELMREDGVIFVSIDDHEVHHLRLVLDEVFGREHFLGQLIWKKGGTGKIDSRHLVVEHEYILGYARDAQRAGFADDPEAKVTTRYDREDERGRYSLVRLDSKTLGYQPTLDFPIPAPDGSVRVPEQPKGREGVARWRWSEAKVRREYDALVFEGAYVYTKNYEKIGARPRSLLVDERFGVTRSGKADADRALGAEGLFDYPKPVRLIRHLLRIACGRGDLALDFFAGSGTTGEAVLRENLADGGARRFILVQLPEPIDEADKGRKRAVEYCRARGLPLRITELTKARLRGVAAHLAEEAPPDTTDLGFRVLSLEPAR